MQYFAVQEENIGKTKNEVGERRPEWHIVDCRNKRIEQTIRRQRRMEVSSAGAQGPEGAVLP